MKTTNIILCGLGGQGILFMTKVLAQTALRKGCPVLGAETHGMAQRGGSVISHLRIGRAQSSLIRAGTADLLLAAEENEAYRNLPFLARGGKMYANADNRSFPREETRSYLAGMQIQCRSVPATALAVEGGAVRAANLALLGFFAACEEEPLGAAQLRDTIKLISPQHFRAANLKLFDAGLGRGSESKVG
jgi:indolepyruvate ferredoxin oxidoreductase beta subunit